MKKLRKMTQQEVDEMCKKHEAWLENRADGARADFSGASLKGLSLKNADLNAIPNMSKRTSTQLAECLNAVQRKAGSFRLRGVTADQKP